MKTINEIVQETMDLSKKSKDLSFDFLKQLVKTNNDIIEDLISNKETKH